MLRNHLTTLLALILTICMACHQEAPPAETEQAATSTGETSAAENAYDPALAEQVGADEYGMKPFVLAYLKRGPNRDRSAEEAQELQRAHLDNITRMPEAGQLVIAGPFMDDGDIRGIYIFDVRSVEEAQKLTETDPAIQAGSLEMELHPWYGPAALVLLQDLHPKVTKKEI